MRRAVVIAVLLAGGSAWGDDALERMRELFERGQDAYEAGKYELAASEFRAAYAVRPAASLLYNQAVCHERLGDPSRAVQLFRGYLDDAPRASDRAAVEKRIADLERRVSVAPAATRGVVFVDSKPAGASLWLDSKDGAPIGTTPWNGAVEGTHVLIVEAPGHVAERRTITGRAGVVNNLYFSLAQPQFLSFVEVFSNVPGAEVYIDERSHGPVGVTPYRSHLTPGKHRVIVGGEGLAEVVEEVDFQPGKVGTVRVKLAKAPVGYVVVRGRTVDGATVKLDGVPVCRAPCRFATPAGARAVTVEKPGLKPLRRTVEVGSATEIDLAVRLAPRQPRTDLVWKAALAAAAIGGGIYLGVQANGIQDSLERDLAAGMPPLASDDDRYLRGKIYALSADGLFLAGGAVAIYSAISLLSEKGPPSTAEVAPRELFPGLSLAPAVGPGYGGVSAEARF
jgi:hypothetical protein